tara:strand:+ start:2129 stop:8980 length:6852 start_codon:yes stop_codon:yes gene_type:complete
MADEKDIQEMEEWAKKGQVAASQTQASKEAGNTAFQEGYSQSLKESSRRHRFFNPLAEHEDYAVPADEEQAYQELKSAIADRQDAQEVYNMLADVQGLSEKEMMDELSGEPPRDVAPWGFLPGDNKEKVEDASTVKTPASKPGSRTGDHFLDVIKKNKIDTLVSDSVIFQLKNGQLVNSIRTMEDLEQYVFQRISLRDLIIFSLSCAENGMNMDVLKWLDNFLKALGGMRIPKFAINIPRMSFKDLMAKYAANLETAMRKAIEAMIVEYIKKLLVAIASCDFKSAMGAILDPFNDLNNFLKDPEAAFKDLGNKLLDFTRNEAGKAGLGNLFATVEEGVTTMVDPSKSKYMANQTSTAALALGKAFGQELDKSLTLRQKRDLFLGLASDKLLDEIQDKISMRFQVPKEKMNGIEGLKSIFVDMAQHVDLVKMENKITLDGDAQIVSEDTCATFKDKLRRRYASSEDFPDGVPEDIIDQIIDSLPEDLSIDPNAPNSIMDMPTDFDLDECELGVENPISDQLMASVLNSIFGTIKMFFDTEVSAFPIYLSGQDAPPPVPPMMSSDAPGSFEIPMVNGLSRPFPRPNELELVRAASKIETILPDLKNSLVFKNSEVTVKTQVEGSAINFTLRNIFKNADSLLETAGSLGDLSSRIQSHSGASDEEVGSIFAGGSATYLADLTSALEGDPWFDGAKYTIHATKDPHEVAELQKLLPDANPSKIHEVRLYHEIFGADGNYPEALESVFPKLAGGAVTSKNEMDNSVKGEYLDLPKEPLIGNISAQGPVPTAVPNSVWWSQLVTDVWSRAAYTDETQEEQIEKFEGFKIYMANEYLDLVETVFRRYMHGCSLSRYFKPEEILGSSFTKNPFCVPPEGEKDILGISGITSEVVSLLRELECQGDPDAFKKATCSGLTRLYVRTLVMDWVLPSIFAFSQYGAAISNGDALFPIVFKLLEKHLDDLSSVAPHSFATTIKFYSDLTIFEWGGAEKSQNYDDTSGLKALIKQELQNVSNHLQENKIIEVKSSKGLIEEFINTIYNEGEIGFNGAVSDYDYGIGDLLGSSLVNDPLHSYNTYPVLKDVPAMVNNPAPFTTEVSYPTMDYSHGNGIFVNEYGDPNKTNLEFFKKGAFLLEKFVIADLKPIDELPDAPVVKISDNGSLLGKDKLVIGDPSDYFKDVIFDSTPTADYTVSDFLRGHSNLKKFSEITNLQSNWDNINDQLEEVDGKIYNILTEIVDRSRTHNQFTTPTISQWEGLNDTNDYGNGPEPKPDPNEFFNTVGLGQVDSESSLYLPGTTGDTYNFGPNQETRNDRLVFTVTGRTLKPSGQKCRYYKNPNPNTHPQEIDEFCVWIDAQELAEHANAIRTNKYYFGTPDTWKSNYSGISDDLATGKATPIKKDEYGALVKPLPWGQDDKLQNVNSFFKNSIWIEKTEGTVYEEIDLFGSNPDSENAEERVKEQLRARTKEAVRFYIESQNHIALSFTQQQKIIELVDSLELPMPSVGTPSGDFDSILWAGKQIEAPKGFFDMVSSYQIGDGTFDTPGLVAGITGTGFDVAWSFVAKAMLLGKSLQDIFPGFSVFNNTPNPLATKKRFKIYTNGLVESVFPIEGREFTTVYDPKDPLNPDEYDYEDPKSYVEQAIIGASLVLYKLKLFAELQGVQVSNEIDLLARKLAVQMQPSWRNMAVSLFLSDRSVLGYRALTDSLRVKDLSEKYNLNYPIMPKFPSSSERRFWGYGNFREKQSQVEDLLVSMEYYLSLLDGYDTFQGTGADRVLLFVSGEMDNAGLGAYDLSPEPGRRWIRCARTQPSLLGPPNSPDYGDARKTNANEGKSWADYTQYAQEPGGYKPLSLYGPGIIINEQGQEVFTNNKKIKGSESKSYKALHKWYMALQQFATQRRQLLEEAEQLLKVDTFIAEDGATWPSMPLDDFFVNPPEIGIRLSYVMSLDNHGSFPDGPASIVDHLSFKGLQTLDTIQSHPSIKEKSYLIREPAEGYSHLGFFGQVKNKDKDSIRIPLVTKTMPLAEAIGSAGVVAPELSFNLQKDNPGWLMSLNNNKGEFGALEILKNRMIEEPDTRLLLEEIIPLENIITTLYAYMTNSVYFYTNNKTLGMFSTTRAMLIDQLASVNSTNFDSLESADSFDLASATAASTADAQNSDGGIKALMIIQCTLMIYKALVETFDPAVATAKTLKDVVAEVYDSGMRTAHKLAYPDEKWCPDAFSRLLRSSRLVPGYVFALQPFPIGANTLTPLNPFLSLPYLGLALIGLDPKDKSIINLHNINDGMCDEGEEDKQCN